jgi:hypothetical protein
MACPSGNAFYVVDQLKKWHASVVIERAPLNTPYNSPIFPIPLRDENKKIIGMKRLVIDPRPLNAQLIDEVDRMEVPPIQALFSCF